MRILITGATGRVGRSVVEELQGEHELVAFCRHPSAKPIKARTFLGDVTNLGQVYTAMAGVDAVVHLAAFTSVAVAPPDVVFQTNTMGTFNVAEAAANLGVKKVVYSSSGSVLGFAYRTRMFIPEYLPMDEAHPLRPQDPYALSKWVGEEILETITRRTGLQTIVLRPPTVLTPESYAEVVPRLLKGWISSGSSILSYVDALDFAQAVRLALEDDTIVHDRFFISADDALCPEPVCEAFPRLHPGTEEMAKALGATGSPISSARAKRILGYRPRHSWRDYASLHTTGKGR